MGFIEAALAATRSWFSSFSPLRIPTTTIPSPSSLFQKNVRSTKRIIFVPKNKLVVNYIEDLREEADQSYFNRYRKRRGLSVTDITSTEWCQKQMEFVLREKKMSKAMKAGHDRFVKLENES